MKFSINNDDDIDFPPAEPSLIKRAAKDIAVSAAVELVCGFIREVILPKIKRIFGEEKDEPLSTVATTQSPKVETVSTITKDEIKKDEIIK